MDTNLAYVLPDNDDDLDQVPEIHEWFQGFQHHGLLIVKKEKR